MCKKYIWYNKPFSQILTIRTYLSKIVNYVLKYRFIILLRFSTYVNKISTRQKSSMIPLARPIVMLVSNMLFAFENLSCKSITRFWKVWTDMCNNYDHISRISMSWKRIYPRGRPQYRLVMITIFTHVVRTSVPKLHYQAKIIDGRDCGLTEWIIAYCCVVIL